MKEFYIRFKNSLIVSLLMISVVFVGCENDEGMLEIQEIDSIIGYEIEPIEGQYVVVLHEESSVKNSNVDYQTMKGLAMKEITSTFSKIKLSPKKISHTYSHALNGFTASLDNEQLVSLQKDSRVKSIEQDYLITLGKPSWAGGGNDEPEPGQKTPWGIIKVNGVTSYSGSGVAWVIDSGIDLDHPDLNTEDSRHVSFLGGKDRNDPDDGNGHGTHVAGTIAALNNEIGVVGVAPGATVVSVRVLNKRGSGSYSGVIAGVDYVGDKGSFGDVANMSLGGGVSETLDNAVINAASTGVIFCLAAGNESDDTDNHSPARANDPNIYTIAASDSDNSFASFSNYGPEVDYCAPGVSVESTWKNGGYNTISGTSMAAPHAAGVLLQMLSNMSLEDLLSLENVFSDNPINTNGLVEGVPAGTTNAIISL